MRRWSRTRLSFLTHNPELLELKAPQLEAELKQQLADIEESVTGIWLSSSGSSATAYLANRAGRNIEPATLRKYRTFVKQFRDFANDKGTNGCLRGRVAPVQARADGSKESSLGRHGVVCQAEAGRLYYHSQ